MKKKPFEYGDIAVCVANHYYSAPFGTAFRVKKCRPCKCDRHEWVIEVDHWKYGHCSYMAFNFITEAEWHCRQMTHSVDLRSTLITNTYKKEEPMNMYVVAKLVHTSNGDDELREVVLSDFEKSLSSAKRYAAKFVRDNPNVRLGIFELKGTVEHSAPPVTYTDVLSGRKDSI